MLSTGKVRHIRRLLDRGFTYRRIQQLTGVSRVTIGRIARRERPDHAAVRPAEQDPTEADEPAGRCAKCGHHVVPPCRICRVRKAVAARALRRVIREVGFGEPLGLELRAAHQERYEEVRAQRNRQQSRLPGRRPRPG